MRLTLPTTDMSFIYLWLMVGIVGGMLIAVLTEDPYWTTLQYIASSAVVGFLTIPIFLFISFITFKNRLNHDKPD